MNDPLCSPNQQAHRMRVIAAILSFFLIGTFTIAQEQVRKRAVEADLAMTFGFVEGQKFMVERLTTKYPSLKLKAIMAVTKWDTSFARASTAVEQRLSKLMADQWPALRQQLMEQNRQKLIELESGYSERNAEQYIDEIDRRSSTGPSGAMLPVKQMLLSCHPDFAIAPDQEFTHGWVNEFSSAAHPKAKGLELKLKVPASWSQAEGDRPNIVQKWRSDGGHGDDQFILQIRSLPPGFTAADVQSLFTKETAAEFADGGTLISFKVGTLEKLPLGIIHSRMKVERVDVSLDVRNLVYYLVASDRLIMMQFMCMCKAGVEASDARMRTIEPLARLIAASLVLPAQY